MLMALRFEPSRFFLKGKVTQKQTSYKNKHTLREEVSQVCVRCNFSKKSNWSSGMTSVFYSTSSLFFSCLQVTLLS